MTKVSYPQITLKVFTKKILKHISQGVGKLTYEVLTGLLSDIVLEYELIVGSRFILVEDETDFEFERLAERKTQGNRGTNVGVPVDSKIVFKELSEKSGIPIWKIIDHVLRLLIKYGYFTRSNRQWKKSIREAIKRQSSREDKSNLKKIQVVEVAPVEETPAVVERRVPPLRAVARNRMHPPQRFKPIPIKLKLRIDYLLISIRKALSNFHRWVDFNVDEEIIPLLLEVELNRNPLTREVIEKHQLDIHTVNILCDRYLHKYNSEFSDKKQVAKDVYELIGIKWNIPPWVVVMYQLIDLYKMSKNYRKVRDMNFTVEDWFEEYDVNLPEIYEGHKTEFILKSAELERLGIAEALDLKIKEMLKMEDEFEYALINYDELEEYEKIQIETRVRWEFKDHEYAQILREKFKRYIEKRDNDLNASRSRPKHA